MQTNSLKTKALEILNSGIHAVLPSTIIKNNIKYNPAKKILFIKNKSYALSGRIFIIGAGKASGQMAEQLEKIIGPQNITAGIINCKNNNYKTQKIKIIKAGHPIPDQQGLKSTEEILTLKEKFNINKNDLIICLLSGGASSMLPGPKQGITLEDLKKMYDLQIKSSADITEINTVRKQISKIKGGQFGLHFAPAKIISLIISDVIGNDLSIIASGPTAPNLTTNQDAYKILEKYNLISKTPANVLKVLETSSKPIKNLPNCENIILADNLIALKAMSNQAKLLSFNPKIITSAIQGDPEKQAQFYAAQILQNKYEKYNALILGGETTPKIPDQHGQGGRNQHYIASSLLAFKNYQKPFTITSLSSDGSDFMPDIAGAIIDNESTKIINNKKINIQDYLKNFDSYNLLKQLNNSLVKTGPTGTNIGDLIIYLLA